MIRVRCLCCISLKPKIREILGDDYTPQLERVLLTAVQQADFSKALSLDDYLKWLWGDQS